MTLMREPIVFLFSFLPFLFLVFLLILLSQLSGKVKGYSVVAEGDGGLENKNEEAI